MENISLSLPKRSFSSNPNAAFTSHKSVYDDVFGGPPKFGLPTLAPRLQDYSEIFGGFHASRSSSIPLLELPLVGDDSDLHFDAQRPSFDYAEVFGEFGGLNFTASFEDLLGQSSGGGYNSSDEPWSPAQSGSFSDELEPLAGSDQSHSLSDGDIHQSLQNVKQFNASYNKSSQRSTETVLAASSHAVPEYTFSHCESPVSWDGEDDHCSMGAIDDHNKGFGERVGEGNQYKCLSSPLPSCFDTHGNEGNPLEQQGNSSSLRDKPFVTVCDISLRTKPSQLPPPSRPPPLLVVKKGERDRSNSKLKASKSYAFDRVADDRSKIFFDVEFDAAISVEGGRDRRNENVEVMRQITKEPTERKDDMQVQEKINKTLGVSSDVKDEKWLQSHGTTTVSVPVIEETIESTKRNNEISKYPGVQCCHYNPENSTEAIAWSEETEYFEVTEKKITRKTFNNDEYWDTSMQHMKRDAHIHQGRTEYHAFNQKEDCKEFKVTKELHRWDEVKNKQNEIPKTTLSDQRGSTEKLVLNKLTCAYDSSKKVPENILQLGEYEKLQTDHKGTLEVHPETKGNLVEAGAKLDLKGSPKRMNTEKRFVEKSGKHKQNILREEFHRRIEDVEGAETTREIVKETTEAEGIEEQYTGFSGKQKNKLGETYELKENDVILIEAKKHIEGGKESYVAAGHDKSGDNHLAYEKDMELGKLKVIELTFRDAPKLIGKDEEHKMIHERDAIIERNGDAPKTDNNSFIFGMAATEAGNKEEALKTSGNMNSNGDAGFKGLLSGHSEELEPIEGNGHEREIESELTSHVFKEGDQLKVSEGGYKVDELITANVYRKHDNVQVQEVTDSAFSSEGNGELKTECNISISESETGNMMDETLARGRFNEYKRNKGEFQEKKIRHVAENTVKSPCLPRKKSDSNICNPEEISYVMPDKVSSGFEYSHDPVTIIFSDNDRAQRLNNAEFVSKRVDIKDNLNPSQVVRESVIISGKVDDDSSLLKQNDDTLFSIKKSTCQQTERKDVYTKDNLGAKNQKVGERIRREIAQENEHIMRKLEEEREREREREKDRMAVDKAALEARERPYSEARERAERYAVERATAEVRQRAMAETREREKALSEARLRAERAAVERATAEARQRAAEKLMAQRVVYNPRDQVERSVVDRFSASSRSADTRQSYVPSDLHFQSIGIPSVFQYSYSSAHEGAEGESPQRCKARLERYRRTAERAANALAEKNKRDLLVQREREERNRVAEALDAEVKRWSSGKEGNLRALLSTLQYILGPDSGWHPVPLTEVITSAAVKKAYRKATLCVHPDKLQQRGATIQQKYICEKVFDLLKEAWNKFNSVER